MTWADQAGRFAAAAERAWADGDKEAFVELITAAAQCVQIAKNLAQSEQAISDIRRRAEERT